MTMKYRIRDARDNTFLMFDTEADALAAIDAINAQILQREAARFGLAKEVVVTNGTSTDTVWAAVDTANDPEVGTYYVFNHTYGRYEQFSSLAAAIARDADIKAQFMRPFAVAVEAVDAAAIILTQPVNTGMQTL